MRRTQVVKLLASGAVEWEEGGDRVVPLPEAASTGLLRASCRFGDHTSLEISPVHQQGAAGTAASKLDADWAAQQQRLAGNLAAKESELQPVHF